MTIRPAFTIDAKRVQKSIGVLQGQATQDDIKAGVLQAAEFVISKAQKRAPTGFGRLKNTDFVERVTERNDSFSVELGFSAPYAAIQDLGWKTATIKPRKAKKLFIPLSRRARRVGPTKGATRAVVGGTGRGGLQVGKDFVFADKVKTPKAQEGGHVGADGEQKGPNFYFSGALKKSAKSGVILRIVNRVVRAGIGRRLNGGA